MPKIKMKTHKSTSKRIKITGSGRMLHKQAGKDHKLIKKSSKRKRKLNIEIEFASVDRRRLKKLISKA